MSKLRAACRLSVTTAGWLAFSAVVQATTVSDLTELPLEDLMKIAITSASKRPETLFDTPAAAFVITSDDIRRSGALSIPEALRLAPGIQVARINEHGWAISARGFNGRFANKLLVLIDGRAVYTPLYSGVFWDRQDVMMENIDRIEVIRGPGAALWGANAVNGVINVITKDAADTQGNAGGIAYSSKNDRIVEHRYGGAVGDATHYRVYAKYLDRAAKDKTNGASGNDETEVSRFGFRSDWDGTAGDEVTVLGSYATGHTDDEFNVASLTAPFSTPLHEDSETNAGYMLGRWTHRNDDGSDFQVQVYNDYTSYKDVRVRENRNTTDLEVQHTRHVGERHQVVMGGGVRRSADRISNSFAISFDPAAETTYLFNAFIDDTISLIDNELSVSVGTKIERNDYTGVEFQPSLRGLWHVNNRNTLWAGVSRAVRTPSRAERDVTLNGTVVAPFGTGNPTPFPATVPVVGSDDLRAETLFAYEAGYRVAPTNDLTFDLAAFYNDYDELTGVYQGATTLLTTPVTHTRTPLIANNGMQGETYGVEIAADYRPAQHWRFRASYTFVKVDVRARDNGTIVGALPWEGMTPQQQVQLWGQTDLARDVTLDVVVRYVDSLPALSISDYITADARIGWDITENFRVSLIGRNLLQNGHLEFGSENLLPSANTVADRQVFAVLQWQF